MEVVSESAGCEATSNNSASQSATLRSNKETRSLISRQFSTVRPSVRRSVGRRRTNQRTNEGARGERTDECVEMEYV